MAIFFNMDLDLPKDDYTYKVWEKSACNDSVLVIINKALIQIRANEPTNTWIHFLKKGNHSFLFIHRNKKNKEGVYGVFISDKRFEVVKELSPHRAIVFEAESKSDNYCYKLGLYRVGTVIFVNDDNNYYYNY